MREEFKNSHLWYKRFLPHYKAENKYQMITYRLSDSLPQNILKSLGAPDNNPGAPQSSASKNPLGAPQSSADIKAQEIKRRKLIESSLDKGYGSCLLQIPEIAEKVIDTWKFYHSKQYELIAYVVMPNHVHVLIKTLNDWPIGKIVWAWKSYIAKFVMANDSYKSQLGRNFQKREVNLNNSEIPEERMKYMSPAEGCGAPGVTLWQREYWDRFIRNENHFKKAVEYIHMNPVKAGLVASAKEWKWSSFHEGNE